MLSYPTSHYHLHHQSLSTGIFPDQFKNCSVHPHLNITETTLLSVHDHIIKAVSHQKVTCLTLLDVSAAFDTRTLCIMYIILYYNILFCLNVFHPALAFLLLLSLGSNLIIY